MAEVSRHAQKHESQKSAKQRKEFVPCRVDCDLAGLTPRNNVTCACVHPVTYIVLQVVVCRVLAVGDARRHGGRGYGGCAWGVRGVRVRWDADGDGDDEGDGDGLEMVANCVGLERSVQN